MKCHCNEIEELRAEVERLQEGIRALADDLNAATLTEQPLADRYAGYYAGVVSAQQKVEDSLRALLAPSPADRVCVCAREAGPHPAHGASS